LKSIVIEYNFFNSPLVNDSVPGERLLSRTAALTSSSTTAFDSKDMAKLSPEALQQAQQRTLDRLNQVKTHFDKTKGTGRFGGKVAILTGVGSEKGIG
jgi:hypothetical protein